MSHDAVIGFGSNLGDRRAHFVRARARLGEICSVVASSSIYETEPIGPAQPKYLNAAVRVRCVLEPDALLRALLRIESEDGRDRATEIRFGPRTIDLDILWIKDLELHGGVLEVPHPRLHERAFALVPLYEVAPDATDPKTGLAWPVPAPSLLLHSTW